VTGDRRPFGTVADVGTIGIPFGNHSEARSVGGWAVTDVLPTEIEEELYQLRSRVRDLEDERDKLDAALNQKNRLEPYQIELIKLQRHLEQTHTPMIVVFEGRDASGKGGTIRRITRYMNEKRYRVVALGKPTDEQRTQWYFQRYVQHFPSGGEIVLFDRSWYNRAMVEPVFGFCTKKEYRDFLRGVVGFEKDVVRQGTVLVKLYFSVEKATQAQRFDRRRNDPLRQWKLSEIDVQAQEFWDDFTEMKYTMLERTSTTPAPWTIVRSNTKSKARLNAMKVILNSVDYDGRNAKLDYKPDPEIVISGKAELARMDEERDRLGRPRQ
jgi:polyphosphate kinase